MSDLSPSAASEVPSPRLVGSWETLGLLPIERVPMWAAYWIVGGHDGEALVRLAGLHGDDPREVHDALPDALRDCGVEMPDSDVAAATVAFTHAARLYVAGQAGPEWVLNQVYLIVTRSAYGSRSAYGLLYLAAVRGDWREHEDRRHRFANTLSKPASLSLVKVTPSATWQTYWRYGTLTGCWNGASRW